jgi:sugar phosphate isomerase/epimerase
MKRRVFLGAGLVAGYDLLLSKLPLPVQKKFPLGLQLYTVRDSLQRDLPGTLERIANLGLKEVESADYEKGLFYGRKPLEFKKILRTCGLKMTASHSTCRLTDADLTIAAAKEAGATYLVYPYIEEEQRRTLDDWRRCADLFNRLGEKCAGQEMIFAYHNHDFDFQPMAATIPYRLLLEKTDPKIVKMELDLYWIARAGHDARRYFETYPGRFILWHLKDQGPSPAYEFLPLGRGRIDFKALFAYADKAGLVRTYIEQDESRRPIFDCLQESVNYMRKLGVIS